MAAESKSSSEKEQPKIMAESKSSYEKEQQGITQKSQKIMAENKSSSEQEQQGITQNRKSDIFEGHSWLKFVYQENFGEELNNPDFLESIAPEVSDIIRRANRLCKRNNVRKDFVAAKSSSDVDA